MLSATDDCGLEDGAGFALGRTACLARGSTSPILRTGLGVVTLIFDGPMPA